MWYNHVAGELINLAGNNDNHHDTYLQPGPCGIDQYGYEACELVATTHFYKQWVEKAA